MPTLNFQPATPQSCAPLLKRGGLIYPRGCDTSIINLCCWQHTYRTAIAGYNGNYAARFLLDGHYIYSLRFRPQDLPALVEMVKADAEYSDDNSDSLFSSLPREALYTFCIFCYVVHFASYPLVTDSRSLLPASVMLNVNINCCIEAN